MQEVVPRETYEAVLLIATLPALAFVIWLSWMITNRLMSPEWQQKRRSAQIRKAVAEREALVAGLRAASAPPKDENRPGD